MKRQLLIGLVLLLLIAAAIGTYFGVDIYQSKKEAEEAETTAALQLGNFNSDSVTKLVLHSPDFDYTLELDSSGEWQVTSGETLHINTYYAAALCTYGSTLTAAEDLGAVEDTATLESYGLADPISITYYTTDLEKTIYIGSISPTQEYFYVMQENDDHVYLVSSSTAGYLYVTKSQLRYCYLMDDKTSDFTQISLKKGDEIAYTLEKDDSDTWHMTEPVDTSLEIDASTVSSFITSLIQLEADDFGDEGITEADYATYGFDNPAYTFQFTQSTGETTTLLVEDYDPLVSSYVDCLHVETGEILRFDSSYLNFLQADTGTYLLSTLYKPGISDVTEMTLQYEGSFNDKTIAIDASFTLDNENSTYCCNGTQITEEDTDAVTAFENFFSAAASMTYESIENTAEVPTDDNPAYRVEYTLSDGTSHTLELVQKDSNTYWAFLDGAFTYATVRQRALSGDEKVLDRYTDLMEAVDALQ